MYDPIKTLVENATKIVVIQAENPDGDSLGSSIALEGLLSKQGKTVTMFCPVMIPRYLRYIEGWDRVEDNWTGKFDLAIIVDTSSETLISKVLDTPGARHFLENNPVIVLDHHVSVVSSLPFEHSMVLSTSAVSTGQLIYEIACEAKWDIDKSVADALYISIMSDSLGLTTQNTTPEAFRVVASLLEAGTIPAELEASRRELMKKSSEILAYKGKLIERIEYFLDGSLSLVHITWEDIAAYSDQYNPSMLVLDEMRLVEGVEVAVALKTYPDGKITGKLRANIPVCDAIAGYFGGGGHPYAAGFRVYDTYDTVVKELLVAVTKAKQDAV